MPDQTNTFKAKTPNNILVGWLPALVGILLCFLTSILWWTLNQQEQASLQNQITAEAEDLAAHIDADLHNRLPTLQRMAKKWELQGSISEKEFTSEARSYLADAAGFQALEWVDKDFFVRWIVPLAGNEQAQNLNLALEQERRLALEKAKENRSPAMTSPIDLKQGGIGFLVYFPIYLESDFAGVIVAVFRTQEWLDYVFDMRRHHHDTSNDFRISVSMDGLPVYKQAEWDALQKFGLSATANTETMGHRLSLHIRATPDYIARGQTLLPKLTAMFGVLLSVLLASVVHLLQKFGTSKTTLETEIRDHQKAEERLRESEQRFRSLVETTSDWVWEIDKNGVYTYVSPKVEDLLGYRPEEVIGKTPFDFMPSEEAQRVKALFLDITEAKIPFSDLENSNRRKDGRIIVLESSGVPVFDRDGVFARYRGIDRDISKRKQAEIALAAEQQRLAYILEGTNVGTWEWNVQSGETVFNERWAETIGYTLAELAPVSIETWIQFAHPDDLAASTDLLQRHFRKELPYYECEARMRHKNGDWVWVLDRGKVATWTVDEKPLVMCGTHQDITDRKRAEEEIRHLATHDILTDLPSLRLAKDRLTMALNLARRHKSLVAVMFVDLDGFKTVNDTLGHDAGDHVLKEVSKRLLSFARSTDTVARIGGDEFLFIGTEMHGAENAAQIAKKVLHAVSLPILFKGQQAVVGASIGIALFPEHSDSMDQLIKLADEAMYQIKNTGKNGFGFATPR